ncbi:biotin--[acetyl-CoA-carboxylase] ligase [soil metagenome]
MLFSPDLSSSAPDRFLGNPLIELDCVNSTMDAVSARIAGAAEGLTVVANHQTTGRGRSGRRWVAAPGTALLFSTLLRPNIPISDFESFPVLLGVGIAEVIETATGVATQLKWPNDVLIDGRKLAGTLVTTRIEGGVVTTAVFGVGVNLIRSASGDLPETAIALEEATDRSVLKKDLLDSILHQSSLIYSQLINGERGDILSRWLTKAAFLGESVSVQQGSRSLMGTFEGVGSNGALRLIDAEGELHQIRFGELARGPVRDPAQR